jgi:hypothetical protein
MFQTSFNCANYLSNIYLRIVLVKPSEHGVRHLEREADLAGRDVVALALPESLPDVGHVLKRYLIINYIYKSKLN